MRELIASRPKLQGRLKEFFSGRRDMILSRKVDLHKKIKSTEKKQIKIKIKNNISCINYSKI